MLRVFDQVLNYSHVQLKRRDLRDRSLDMVDADVEVEVWASLSVRGKLVSFSSLGRFQDANGINM